MYLCVLITESEKSRGLQCQFLSSNKKVINLVFICSIPSMCNQLKLSRQNKSMGRGPVVFERLLLPE